MSLERALALAERGRGQVEHTHPLVGAVVVSGGEVVGEGWYAGHGSPHAEVVALEAADERARGATLFVAATAIFGREDLPRAYRRLVQALA